MSAHVLLNLLNELGKRQDARLCGTYYRFSPNEFNEFNKRHKDLKKIACFCCVFIFY